MWIEIEESLPLFLSDNEVFDTESVIDDIFIGILGHDQERNRKIQVKIEHVENNLKLKIKGKGWMVEKFATLMKKRIAVQNHSTILNSPSIKEAHFLLTKTERGLGCKIYDTSVTSTNRQCPGVFVTGFLSFGPTVIIQVGNLDIYNYHDFFKEWDKPIGTSIPFRIIFLR